MQSVVSPVERRWRVVFIDWAQLRPKPAGAHRSSIEMARIAVIGAGLTGLGAALFLARRGHDVDLLEQDGAGAPDDRETCFSDWKRRGVPQARHSHHFLGLSSKVLSTEAPDLLASLEASGPFRNARWGDLEGEHTYALMARRLVYEAVFRRTVERESGVTVHRGARVRGLVARSAGGIPRVVGVNVDEQGDLAADFVADASGRWTRAGEWLAEIGARPWAEELQETPIFYLTRWYRLKEGRRLPPGRYPVDVILPYLLVLAFPADNGTFSVSMAPSMADPFRARLRDPDIHAAFLNLIPAIAPWIERGEPITEPFALARINNCHRRLVGADGPCVTGLALLGDAANHTNPTLGRGVSLGLAHAQHLAKTAERAVADPIAHALEFDRWTADNVGAWFRSQVVADGALMRGLNAGLAGEAPPPPLSETLFRRAMTALADTREEPDVTLAVARDAHVLTPPGSVQNNPSVAAKVRAFMVKAATPPLAPNGPSRREFEALVGP
jgi:2-polyprenyl-6-methoxyphenol hydroxylase-like FAD-dependent oxidoreductase